MQQDAVAMRMVMRLAYATVNPVTVMNPAKAMTARWPFGAVLGVGTTPPTAGPITIIGTYPGGTLLSAGTQEVEAGEVSTWEQGAREAADEALARTGDGEDKPVRTTHARRSTARSEE
jgi:hypothetical protein